LISIKNFLVNFFPFLGFYKRILKAAYDSIRPLKTYSQHGEDLEIYDFLSRNNLLNGIYMDVGANHPTSISNTYLFYRKGYRGVSVEPNSELARLHRWFRRGDKVIEVGIGNSSGILEFHISKTPVLSSFKKIDGSGLWKTEYIPVLTLDNVTEFVKPERIFLLNVDTEGFNFQVIQGGKKTLALTDLLCIEVDDDEDEALITHQLTTHNQFHRIKKIGCNLLFANKTVADKLQRVI
jgi:FkbM family methyltransferase